MLEIKTARGNSQMRDDQKWYFEHEIAKNKQKHLLHDD